ncbi:MAG: IS110 family transposase [Acidobacteriaceae bacterium]|nr:IS110 family transposase [Acidobacteriaceae bacterium]
MAAVAVTCHFFVGIDWGNEAHHVCVLNREAQIVQERRIQHTASAVAEFLDWLSGLALDFPESMAVAIEVPHGPLVEELLERRFHVLFINPKQLDRFRDRYFPAGAKDDSRDAFVLADSLRTDQHCFRAVCVGDPAVIRLRELTRLDEELNLCFQRHCCQLRQQLQRYYPQMLQLSKTADEAWIWALIELAPTPDKAAQITSKQLEKLLHGSRIRRVNAEQVATTLRGRSFSLATGTVEAASEHVLLLLPHLRLLHQQRLAIAARIDQILDQLGASKSDEQSVPDVIVLRSLPGVGRLVTATMLAEAPQLLAGRDYRGLRAYGGVAPITRRSGKKSVVLMRYGCNLRLRNALYHWSRVNMQHDARTREQYHRLRSKGHNHGRALRGVADRLLALLCAMLRSGSPYDPVRRQLLQSPSASGLPRLQDL